MPPQPAPAEGFELLVAKAVYRGAMPAPALATTVDEARFCTAALLATTPPLQTKVWVRVTTRGVFLLRRGPGAGPALPEPLIVLTPEYVVCVSVCCAC